MQESGTPQPGYFDSLTFNAPLSGERADRIARDLASIDPTNLVDVGCGWGELLLRVLSAHPTVIGVGVDVDAAALARGRANAETRGLGSRVRFVEADASEDTDDPDVEAPADAVICIGSSQVFGGTIPALAALRKRVRPGGRLLFGEGYWERMPSVREAARFGSTPGECVELADLVELTIAAGFRPLRIESAGRDEWAEFESGFLADWEHWLLAYGDRPEAEKIRRDADEHRNQWLRGYRDILGFAYLTLGVPKPVSDE